MTSKGIKNLFGGLFHKSKPDKNVSETVSVPLSREKEMIARLQAIDLEHPRCGLSDDKVRELNLPVVLHYVCSELRFSLIPDRNIVDLDNHMRYIIDALSEAIQEGREMTVEWACAALICAVKNLRTDILVDQEYAGEASECRVQYSENLKLLIEQYRAYDLLRVNLEEQRRRRDEKHRELLRLKDHFQTRRDSGALDPLIAELQQHAHAPAKMSDEAMALRDELSQLHLYGAYLIEIDAAINADQVALNNRAAEIENRYSALSDLPHVTDPKLQERLDQVNRLYREKLRRALSEAEESLRSYDIHNGIFEELVAYSVRIGSTPDSWLPPSKPLEQLRAEQMLAELQAREMAEYSRMNAEKIRQMLADMGIQPEEYDII